jgi:putative peptide zinc metalloprotease protein
MTNNRLGISILDETYLSYLLVRAIDSQHEGRELKERRSVDNLPDLRPRLRDDISFGPPESKAGRVVYYVNDRYTDQFYGVGERERFLFGKMDGSRSLTELAAEYESRFGRSLNGDAWDGLFKLLDARQMLEGRSRRERLDELRAQALERKRQSQGWFKHRFHLVNPDALLARLLPRLRFMFRPGVVATCLGLILAAEIWVIFNLGQLVGAAWPVRKNAYVWPVFMMLVLLSSACHEMAHGLACKYFGGTVNDMGVMWRYLWFYPYCKLDYIILFHDRRRCIWVAFAGTFMSLLLMLPFVLVWALAPESGLWHTLSAKVLTWYNAFALLNLVPFVQLDGYFMLSHALGMSELRQE